MISANAKTEYEKEYTLVSLFLLIKKSEYLRIQCMHKRKKKKPFETCEELMYQYIAYPFDAFIDVTILLLLIEFISFIDCEIRKEEALKK